MMAAYWRQGHRFDHPHNSGYKPLHQNLEGAAGERVLTGEVVGAVATDSVEMAEMAPKLGKILQAQLLSYTQASQILGKA
jgi:hypothetical protein